MLGYGLYLARRLGVWTKDDHPRVNAYLDTLSARAGAELTAHTSAVTIGL